MEKEYRIKPIIIGNRCASFQLQHKTFWGWKDTVFENGKVKTTKKDELIELIKHLKSSPEVY